MTQKVIYIPENKVYDFGYVTMNGRVVLYEEGERNMQDSYVVDAKDIRDVDAPAKVTTEIDNFTLIADIIRKRELTEDEFFFLQIIKRKKDNPNIGMSHEMVIHNWFIKDAEYLLQKKDVIIKQCEDNNARAYFRLNKRSYKKIALQTLALIATNIASGNYNIKNCYESCAGQHHSDVNKTWILDIDDGEFVLTDDMRAFIQELVFETKRVPIFHQIPTKNGYHIVCPPFNIKAFQDRFGALSFHKDNPTILYIP